MTGYAIIGTKEIAISRLAFERVRRRREEGLVAMASLNFIKTNGEPSRQFAAVVTMDMAQNALVELCRAVRPKLYILYEYDEEGGYDAYKASLDADLVHELYLKLIREQMSRSGVASDALAKATDADLPSLYDEFRETSPTLEGWFIYEMDLEI
jgi:hypothetical protein